MPATARVYITGDASSIKKAMEEAGLYAEAASVKIAKAGKATETGFLSMSGAGKKAASELEHTTGRIGSALAGIATSGNIAIAGIAAVGAAVYGIKRSADTFEEIGKAVLKLHNLTGLSVQSASQYAAVAKVNDINVKGLMMSFTTLSKNVQAVSNAHDGLTKSAHTQENAFKTLGLPLKDVIAAHGNINKLLPQVITAFEHLPGSVNKAATAQALFGRGAKELVPLMHTGALGLREQLEEAEKYGASVGKMSGREFKQFLKAQEEAKFAMLGLQIAIGRDVAPALTKLIGGFAQVVKAIHDGSGTIGQAAHAIGAVFGVMFKEMAFAWKIQDEAISAFVSAMAAAVGAVKSAVSAIGHAFGAVAHAVSGALKSAVNAVKGFFNDIYNAGKYLVDGLVKGIASGFGKVLDVGKKLAAGAKEGIESFLGIHSPSKVTHQLGKWTAEGFADGLAAGKGLIAASLHEGIVSPVSKTMAHVARLARLNKATLESLWIKAGGPRSQASTAAAIALAESGGNVGSVGDQGTSFGLWQVHTPAHPQYSSSSLSSDPLYNARAAVAISEGGRTFAPWTTFKTGAYQQFLGGSGGSVMSVGTAAKAVPHLALSQRQAAWIARMMAGGAASEHAAAYYGTAAGEVGDALTAGQARWSASPVDLSTAGGAALQLARDKQVVSSDRAKKRLYEKELRWLRKEAARWAKARDFYRRVARHAKDGHVKKEALDKAAGFDAKVEQAKAAAKELQGSIASTETEILEAQNTEAALPGEQQAADLGAYESANAKVDAEVRAGLKTEAQGKAAKEANARKAEAGGYGPLSEAGQLQVKGDLRELTGALQGNTNATESNTSALQEATKALNEQVQIAKSIGNVEAAAMLKVVADMISGQIAGNGYFPRAMQAGVGTAARY